MLCLQINLKESKYRDNNRGPKQTFERAPENNRATEEANLPKLADVVVFLVCVSKVNG